MVHNLPRQPYSRQSSMDQACFSSSEQSTQRLHPFETLPPQRSPMERDDMGSSDDLQAQASGSTQSRRRQGRMSLGEGLREVCGLPGKEYFVASVGEDGYPHFYFSGVRLSDRVVRQFFDADIFVRVMDRILAGDSGELQTSFDDGLTSQMQRHRVQERRRSSAVVGGSGDPSPPRSGRKRARARNNLGNDGDDRRLIPKARRGMKVGDSTALWDFYQVRFKNCQQTACKLIAKAWVKAVEPKKQSTHPYTGSDEKAPEWWPKPWGPTKEDKVRHKEPDHLYKRERVHLLAHILRMVMEPVEKQHPDIKKLNLSVKKLEETTTEALSSFFVETEANADKRPYLDEVFQVARQEERYRKNELDESTTVYVMSDEKGADGFVSDEEGSFAKDDDDVERRARQSNSMSAASAAPANRSRHIVSPPANAQSTGSYMNDLPVRGSTFQPPMMRDIQQHSFVDNGGMHMGAQSSVPAASNPLTLDIVTSPHNSRRPSVFSDFGSPGGTNMYQQQWPAQGGPSAHDDSTSMYAYSGQHTPMETTSFVTQGIPLNPNSSFMTNSFDETAGSTYDSSQNGLFRSQDMNSASVGNAGFGFAPDDTRTMGSVSHEMMQRHAMRNRQPHM